MSGRSLHVAVVGGGIGGLCLAQGLKKAGVSVAVYERDRNRAERLQGYRIHIDPRGSESLNACLPPENFRAFVANCGEASRSFRMVTEQMETLVHIGISEFPAAPDEVSSHRSGSRITLRQALLEGLGDAVCFDKRFSRYEEAADGRVVAHFEDGSSAVADLLVGADGGNSRVRGQLLPHAERVDTGIVAIAGKVPLNDQTRAWLSGSLLEGPTLVTGPRGRAMFLAALCHRNATGAVPGAIGGDDPSLGEKPGLLFDNTSDYVFWAFSTRRGALPEGVEKETDANRLCEVVLRMSEEWHPDLRRLVRDADRSTMMAFPIRTSTPVEAWPTGNVTLLGDAIHSMTPYRGIGANVALRDAALLTEKLSAVARGETSLLEGVREYEAAMLEYGFAAVRTSLDAMRQAHAEGRVSRAISRTVLRAINAVPGLKRRMFIKSA